MKRKLPAVALCLVLLTTSLLPASRPILAAGEGQKTPVSVLCLPGIYMQDPGDCAPAGPSNYLTQMAQMGITFPLTALPATSPDPDLVNVDYHYGRVRTKNAPVYGSLDDAIAGKKSAAARVIDSSFAYISYSEETVVDGRRFYLLDSGGWMTANDVSRITAVPPYQGLTFNRTPDRAFGWILGWLSDGPVETKRTPGSQVNDYTGHRLLNHEIVQVYGTQKVGSDDWYMIGPDEWLPRKVVARVIPNTTPPQGVTNDRWIEVNLYEQTLAVYDHHELVFATLIASGMEPFWTRPGLFQIKVKLDTTPMRGSFEADHSDAYYLDNVPWTMYFDEARALHGAYWRTQLGYPQSHGCVNLSVGDSHWLYNWANVGDWVYVWDPSGKTPTDPKVYSAGGA
ncbi:MAG TPA: L,D-transpeptidase [Anaerolineales bacterium]